MGPPSDLFRLLYRIGLGRLIGKLILLLTTTGRKSGLPRVALLAYDEIRVLLYLAGGVESDWFKNAKAHPRVHIRVGSREFDGIAEAVTDPCRIADLIQHRLRRHPRIVSAILAAEGLPRSPTRDELEAHARKLAMLIVRPIE